MALGGFNSTLYEKQFPIEWVDSLKLLEITFSVDTKQTINHNYTKCFSQLEKQINILKKQKPISKRKSDASKHFSSIQTIFYIQHFLLPQLDGKISPSPNF